MIKSQTDLDSSCVSLDKIFHFAESEYAPSKNRAWATFPYIVVMIKWDNAYIEFDMMPDTKYSNWGSGGMVESVYINLWANW